MGRVELLKTILSEAKDLVPRDTVQVGARCFAALSIVVMKTLSIGVMTTRTAHG